MLAGCVEVFKPHKCRLCEGWSYFSLDRWVIPCQCPFMVHQSCFLKQIQNSHGKIYQSKIKQLFAYDCEECSCPTFFREDFSARMVAPSQLSLCLKIYLIILIALYLFSIAGNVVIIWLAHPAPPQQIRIIAFINILLAILGLGLIYHDTRVVFYRKNKDEKRKGNNQYKEIEQGDMEEIYSANYTNSQVNFDQ